LEELDSGCAVFGGARLVRNLAPKSEVINAGWGLGGVTASDANTLLESAGGTVHQLSTQISALGTYLLEVLEAPKFGDQDGARTQEFTFGVVHDSTWGKSQTILVYNLQTGL
jgi:hypothetical protein